MCSPSPEEDRLPGPRLRDSFALIAPSLAPELISAGWASTLAAVADALPPVHTAGFECRLGAGARQVDIQQGIHRLDGHPAAIARFLAASASSPEWELVRRLCERWAEPGTSLHEGLSEVWLEVDVPGEAQARSFDLGQLVPSVFAVLRPDAVDGLSVAHDVLLTLVGPASAELLGPVLDRCAAACPQGARVSHLGMMLGRPVPAMRVHVSQLRLDAFATYLADVAWPGDPAPAESLARMLLENCDQVSLCLDVVGGLLPHLGLESFFFQKQGVDPRWRPLLAGLVRLGFCTQEKADALLRWPGSVSPPETAPAWPDDLIVQSLARPEDVFGMVERRLSHVKLTWSPLLPPTAKAYFGFGHVWGSVASLPSPTDELSEPYRPPRRPAATLQESIDAALDHLLGARRQDGWWRDFFSCGRPDGLNRQVNRYASDEWVTAYAGAALAGVLRPRATAAAYRAWELLTTRRDLASGWGYHSRIPPDADSTIWALRLARGLAVPDGERLRAARGFVTGLVGPHGGVATYGRDLIGPLTDVAGIPGSYDGWFAEHTCVTAAAAVLDLDPRLAAFLAHAQRGDGSWTGYWWEDDEYTTALAAEALSTHGEHRDAVARAQAWAVGRIGPDGAVRSSAPWGDSPFATALAVRAVVAGSERREGREAVTRAVQWLLGQQRADGSWAPSARLRVPAPSTLDPGASPGTAPSYPDDEAVFTTATGAGRALGGGRLAPEPVAGPAQSPVVPVGRP